MAQVDWKRLTEKLTGIEDELRTLGQQRDLSAAEAENLEAQLLEADNRTAALNEEIRRAEAQTAANRERIAAAESTIEHERSRGLELEQEIARYRRQLTTMSARAGDLQQQLRDTTGALEAAGENHRNVAQRLVESERGLTEVLASLDQLRGETEQRRAAYLRQMRQAAALANEQGVLESRATAAAASRRRAAQRMAELDRAGRLAAGTRGTPPPPCRVVRPRARASRRRWRPPRSNSSAASGNTPPGKANWPSCASAAAALPNAPRCSTTWSAATMDSATG